MRFVLATMLAVTATSPAAAQDFASPMQRFIALELRLAHGAAITCGFVLDADRFKKRLVEDDVTYEDLFRRNYSQAETGEIAADADAARTAVPGGPYCEKAWKEYGPDAPFGDDVFFKCRSAAMCR